MSVIHFMTFCGLYLLHYVKKKTILHVVFLFSKLFFTLTGQTNKRVFILYCWKMDKQYKQLTITELLPLDIEHMHSVIATL